MGSVRIEWHGCVAQVILSRPERMNAITGDMLVGLIDAGRDLANRADCRAVVLSGAGRGFCSGIDLDSLKSASGGAGTAIDLTTIVADGANIAQHAVMLWRTLPVPVIAAVHGVALGGGFQIALGADIRIVHPDTKMAILEAKWGLVPDMAGMTLLAGLVREDVIAELTFSARMFDGREAERLGIATRIAQDPLAEALALAQDIAGRSPDAIRAAKRLLRHPGPQSAMLVAEAAEQIALFGTPNQREAVAAGIAGRAPDFQDSII
jgi:enoyl-CoA hydratase/carnithine racemase